MNRRLENNFFLLLLFAASAALIWITLPYFGAVLWGIIAAILFAPLNDFLMSQRGMGRNRAALLTLLVIIIVVVVPTMLIGVLLVDEVSGLVINIRNGTIDFGHIFQQFQNAAPDWAINMLSRFGISDFGDVRNRLASEAANRFQLLAGQALVIGQGALGFIITVSVALYLAFFLLRDGKQLNRKLHHMMPLPDDTLVALSEKFIAVTRATINGTMVVAIVQGTIGGIVFALLSLPGALLWGVVMGFASLIPSVGAGLVWVPVAAWFLVTGAMGKAIILIICGVAIIGMVDNVLRPILVGRETRIPDYVVLISTLGGLEIMGFNGIVIGPVIAAVCMSVWEIFASVDGPTADSDSGN